MITKDEIKKFLNKNKNRHLSNKVLHAHPSPMYWNADFDYEATVQSLTKNADHENFVNLYVGIPYCLPTDPPHCGFCLFPTEKYGGVKNVSSYLNYLSKEAKLYKEYYTNAKLESLYIGGGTPNLLVGHDYYELMNIVTDLFPNIESSIEKTLEGIPQLFNEDRIRAISGAGFNRVSMGVQQVSDKLIKYSGRRQTRKQVFDAIDNFHKYDLACNVDLIYAWPHQTIDDMLNDLREISESGIHHITHYELNIAGRSNFSTKMKQEIPSIQRKIEMYHIAKEYLISQGYKQRTVYDWEKTETSKNQEQRHHEQYQYENNLRDFISEDNKAKTSSMGGLGFAAVNMRIQPIHNIKPSISAMNYKTLDKYIDSVTSGKLPIERVYSHTDEDVKLIWLFQSLQEMKINLTKYESIFGNSLLGEFKNIWSEINKENWICIEGDQLVIINDGEFYIPLIQSILAHTRIKQITHQQHTIPLSAIQ